MDCSDGVFHQASIAGGKHWSLTVRSGTVLRLVDPEGGANVGMLFYNPYNVEGGKYGLGRRDLAANVNWFSKVSVDEAGDMTFASAHTRGGDFVDLRFEMDTLVLLHTCPHPLNPAVEYPRAPVAIRLRTSEPVRDDDFCRNFRPENGRGFENTDLYRQCTCRAHGA
jgi:uncharacterized protein YcgI (DUF1989 family)